MLDENNGDANVRVQLVVNDRAEAFVFHNKLFRKKLSWLEFDMDGNRLDFIMNDGDVRNFGIPVPTDYIKYLQNAFQIMVVLMDSKTGEPVEGTYYPLIIHQT